MHCLACAWRRQTNRALKRISPEPEYSGFGSYLTEDGKNVVIAQYHEGRQVGLIAFSTDYLPSYIEGLVGLLEQLTPRPAEADQEPPADEENYDTDA